MSLTADQLIMLLDAGLSAEQLRVVASVMAKPARSSSAERMARKRARDASQSVTCDADVTSQSDEMVSSSPSSSSPPIPPLITTTLSPSNNTGLGAGATDWPANAEVVEIIISEAGIHLTRAETWHLRSAGVVALWRHNGFSFWDEVLPTIKAIVDGGAKIKSWAYFTDAIAECRANRLKPIPIPEPRQTHERRNPDYRDQSAGRSTDYMREAIDLDQQRRGAKLDRASGF